MNQYHRRITLAIPASILFVVLFANLRADDPPKLRNISSSQFANRSDLQNACHLKLCRVLVIEEVDVPALEDGALSAVHVKDGQFVQKGALIAQLDDRQQKLQKIAAETELAAAKERASNNIEILYAQASRDTADAEYQQGLALNAERGRPLVSATEMRRRKLARYRAELEIEKARRDMKIAGMSVAVQKAALDIVDDAIARHKIVAPLDGIVMPVYRGEESLRAAQVGHWVRSGEPVVRIMRMDRLYVEGLVSAAVYSPSEIDGRSVTVTAELARGRKETFEGKVVFISPSVDKRNNYRIRAQVENRTESQHWLLLPGAAANMTIHLAK